MGKLKQPNAFQSMTEFKREMKKWKKAGYPRKIRICQQKLAIDIHSLLESEGVRSKICRTGQTWIITPY